MNERLPYEEHMGQHWLDLPLPDEDKAWADMKKRLEEDDDNGGIVWWRHGCLQWGMLLLVMIGIGWWLLRQPQPANKNNDIASVDSIKVPNEVKRGYLREKPDDSTGVNQPPVESKAGNNDKAASSPESEARLRKPLVERNKVDGELRTNSNASIKKTWRSQNVKEISVPAEKTADGRQSGENPGGPPGMPDLPSVAGKAPNDSIGNVKVVAIDTSNIVKHEDSTVNKTDPADTLSTKDAGKKKDKNKQSSYFFSAGVGLNQQLPVNGQKLTPYNAQGRKGTLADYIPSVYLRYNKTGKWFVQSEFRYGAPQYTKELVYAQKIVPDTSNPGNATITSNRLKKTYYHQLPVSFNYYLLPNWSLGAGIVWNKFNSAVSEQEVVKTLGQPQTDTVISKEIRIDRKDSASAFSKSYFQAVLETQYQWKRFSFGARYSFGLQPYIKFSLPGMAQQEEKNSSLQLFIKYQLWRSKEKASRRR